MGRELEEQVVGGEGLDKQVVGGRERVNGGKEGVGVEGA